MAWREELRAGCKDNDGAPTARELRCLGKLAGDELMERHADGVWRIAIPVYLEALGVYLERMAVGSPGVRGDMTDPAAPATPQCLLDWVLLPFHETSAVFGASGGLYVRDATALLALARCFSNKEFPRTDICPVPLRSRSWEEQVYKGDHQAVLLVGRLWLFGDSAVNDWCHKKARFGFIRHDKPEDCQPPPFDPEYHCIYEELDDGRREYYRTSKNNGEWTDYALIQRYTVQYSGRQIVVVLCAGITSLGTLSAAEYLVSRLNGSSRPGGEPIPLPPGIGPDSSLEALLEVKADATHPFWTPSRVELRKLFVDSAVWSASENKWESSLTITLVCEGGNPERPLAVKIDDREQKMNHAKHAFRLLVAVCLQARESSDGHVDVAKLSQNPWIWRKEKVSETYVRRRLTELKHRHMPPASLSIGEDVRLHAKVVIVAAPELVAVGAKVPGRKRCRSSDGPEMQGPKPR
jgi:hypothetical protein